MKKQIIILFLFIVHISSRSQKSITTDGPCTKAMTMQAKGKWIHNPQENATPSKEINNRLDDFHNMVMKIYPQPTGVDAAWGKTEGLTYFGAKQKSSTYTDGRPKYESVELPHFRKYYYRCGFFPYTCDYSNKNRMLPGFPGETGTWVTITANDDQPAISAVSDDSWTINGFPVKLLDPLARTFPGPGLRDAEKSRNYSIVLIHRKANLPYIPVTRKQYLERCISFHKKLWDENITRTENFPVRSLEEQEKKKMQSLQNLKKILEKTLSD